MEVNVCLIFLILFSAPLFVIGIWGMSAASEIPASITTMQCAMVSFPYNLMEGVDTANGGKWIGIKPLAVGLATMATDMTTKIGEIQNQMSDTSFVKTKGDEITVLITAIPDNFINLLVQKPSAAAVDAIQMNYLKMTGPFTTENTLSWRINKSAFLQVEVIGAMLAGIKTGLDSVTPNFTPIKSAIDSGVTSLNSLTVEVEKMYTSMGGLGEFMDPLKGSMIMGIRNFFVWMIIFGMINVVFAVLIMVCKFKKGRIFLHISWCCMGLSMIFMFLFMSILYPLSFVLFNFCEVLQMVVESEAKMNTLDLKA